jgi:MFS family permease
VPQCRQRVAQGSAASGVSSLRGLKKDGATSLLSKRRGKPSNHRLPAEVHRLLVVVILTILPVSFSNTATATNAALTSDLLRSPADAGRAFAFLVLGGNVFGLLAPIVTGYIVQATGSFASAFVLAGVLALVGAVLSLVLTRHTLGEKVSLAAALAPSAG